MQDYEKIKACIVRWKRRSRKAGSGKMDQFMDVRDSQTSTQISKISASGASLPQGFLMYSRDFENQGEYLFEMEMEVYVN